MGQFYTGTPGILVDTTKMKRVPIPFPHKWFRDINPSRLLQPMYIVVYKKNLTAQGMTLQYVLNLANSVYTPCSTGHTSQIEPTTICKHQRAKINNPIVAKFHCRGSTLLPVHLSIWRKVI